MAKYKVVRTWYTEACELTKAIENTREFNHDQVEVFRLTSRNEYNKTLDANDEGVDPR